MIASTRPIARRLTGLALVTVVATLVTAGAAHATPGTDMSPSVRGPATAGGCTMAIPAARATIEAHLAGAGGFCELVSHALAGDVFRSAVVVMPDRYWHYLGAALSCHLRYRQTTGRVTIHNSAAACRWFTRTSTGWHRETAAGALSDRPIPG
jgi:hypothetical protein